MDVSFKKGSLRASLHTLGCRLNQSETHIIKDKLQASGYNIVPFGEQADLAIINTCTVTNLADSKCRQSIRQFIRKNPKAYTAVVGCYSQMGSKEIAKIEGVDLIVGNQDKLNVLDYIGDGSKNVVPVIVRDKIDKNDFSIRFFGDLPFNARANLKIQDGCDFMCSFCKIPFVRGRARSRDFKNLLEEANSLAQRGVQELILTGVNIGTYNNSEYSIVDVVDALNAIPQISRIRISSIEPTTISLKLFEQMKNPNHALLPYLHIPLQAGSEKVLQGMRRKYSLKEYLDFIHRAKDSVPDLCIGTDIMVGFPGETDDEFEQTCQAFMNNPFAYCHVFSYSERKETLVVKQSKDFVPIPVRHQRSAHLRRLSAKKRFDYDSSYLGQEMQVLFEKPRDGIWPGYTHNYIRVVAKHPQNMNNQLAKVRLDKVSADFVEGTILHLI